MSDLWIRNGRVIDPSQQLDKKADVYVSNGVIVDIAPNLSLDPKTPQINAEGLVVSPGFIDIHTHLREPGQTHKETIHTGSLAAARGGYTTIACMANTSPVNDNKLITDFISLKAKEEAISIFPIGAISKNLEGQVLADIYHMRQSGIAGISDDGKTVMNTELMRQAMLIAKELDLTTISHCEDSCMKGCGVMNEGPTSAKLGLAGIPKASEDIIVARDIRLAELTGAKLHIAHVSTKRSVELIEDALQKGLRVTAEVTPHHLHLTEEAVGQYNTNAKVAPPLRTQEDITAVRNALKKGIVTILATDHAPHSAKEKEVPFELADFGMIGLETAFPLYYQLVLDGVISLSQLIHSLTESPAKCLGINGGQLSKGKAADITVFDPNKKWTVNKNRFASKSRNTPFEGRNVQGEIAYTVASGRIIYDCHKETP